MDYKREEATHKLIDSLKTRYPEKGFLISAALTFSYTSGEGIRVVAKAPIKKDENVLVIPEDTRLGSSEVLNTKRLKTLDKKIRQKCAPWANAHHPEDFTTAVAVMHVLSKKKKSPQDPFTLQAATWPSEEAIKGSSIFYWDHSNVKRVWNKSAIILLFEEHQTLLRQAFDGAIFPVLMSDANNFIDSSLPSNNIENISKKESLWNTFLYAFSLSWSRTHGSNVNDCNIVPLVELFNGNSDRVNESAKKRKSTDKTIINVDLALGKWPFISGNKYIDECNLSCSSVYANRDIEKGEELIISYGELSPMEFMIKYGVVPETLIKHHNILSDVDIWCDPALVPDDPLRVSCLKQNGGYPVEKIKSGDCCLAELRVWRESPEMYIHGYEPDVIKNLRQFLIVAKCADEEELNRNLSTGRLRGILYETRVLPLMCKVIDYNLNLLVPDTKVTSFDDLERARKAETPGWEKAALLARVAYRETLIMWRFSFLKRLRREKKCVGWRTSLHG